ncbi:uncharacterized protein LOC18436052 isoform X1 [Amborella trichopoda]|uniref:uncharacterized protein LOC18436052 isoform X1 n=1 Tax=Amborella trichopoda TaxID=13333 RepID=UPI0005D428D6|nr:uncharacterized protein LOC18436052 isoform X1 [Amborella trichopoda]XP_011624078.1 uncharacterized protein LOC18436052 isoform X1 [Amborella trichopoda]XP_020523980.1 uncharacterized protein LOC18436052 isoform X1 [Amborella trichopoda]|eukprot:XP_011624077.1 uncharacterized protein LOC18436052 isoform X1 [Amborella trichopoda]
MKTSKGMVLTLAERCKNILGANCHGVLYTVKADAKGSNEEIHSSKVPYVFRRGRPYIWIPKDDSHNVNTIMDERGSFSVISTLPGSLMSLLRSVKKLPSRVALTGDVMPLKEDKVHLAVESFKETISLEREAISHAGYPVSGVLSSSCPNCKTRGDNLQEILDRIKDYTLCKFDIRSCTYMDGHGVSHEVDLVDVRASKTDPLSPFTEKLIDGINQSQARRRALMLFCFVYLNANARDAFMLSVDRKGFDILGKVSGAVSKDRFGEYEWKEFRIPFPEEVGDIESFCQKLVEMEEEAVKNVQSFSGLG